MKHGLLKALILIILCLSILVSATSCAKLAQDKLAEDSAANTEQESPADLTVDEHQDTTDVPDVEPEPTPEPEDVTVPSVNRTPEPAFINPLTGEEVSEDISMKRPIAVMTNNHRDAMPQLGISNADIIYEMIVEGGITRMCAIYQDLKDDTVLGSIRSSRHDYLDLVVAHDALYVHAGGSPQAYTDIANRGIDNICGVKGRSDLFYRDPDRLAILAYEHTLCIKGSTLLDYFKNESGYRLEHKDDYKCNMEFSHDVVLVDANAATEVTVDFGLGKKSTLTYNSEDGAYTMYQHGEEYYDGDMNQPVAFKNIIVIQTSVKYFDNKGRQEITLEGTGNGWFICNGEISEITWSRADHDSQFEYFYSDGTPVIFGIGKTYIPVIANAGGVDFE